MYTYCILPVEKSRHQMLRCFAFMARLSGGYRSSTKPPYLKYLRNSKKIPWTDTDIVFGGKQHQKQKYSTFLALQSPGFFILKQNFFPTFFSLWKHQLLLLNLYDKTPGLYVSPCSVNVKTLYRPYLQNGMAQAASHPLSDKECRDYAQSSKCTKKCDEYHVILVYSFK